MKKNDSIDRFALKRDKEMTPGARLDWLAAAWEFTQGIRRSREKQGKKWLPRPQ